MSIFRTQVMIIFTYLCYPDEFLRVSYTLFAWFTKSFVEEFSQPEDRT